MALFLRPLATPQPVAAPFSIVFRDWLESIDAFSNSYHQLYQHASRHQPSEQLTIPSTQVAQLLNIMCQELRDLAVDFDQCSKKSILLAHTTRLKLLTNQATAITRPSN